MKRKFCSLLLSAAMALTTLAGNAAPVSAAEGTNEVGVLLAGSVDVDLSLAAENESAENRDPITGAVDKYVFEEKTDIEATSGNPQVKMDQGNSFWVGFTWDFSGAKLEDGTAVTLDKIEKISGTLEYDTAQFETVQPGDVVVNGNSGSDFDNDQKYLAGWDSEKSRFSISPNLVYEEDDRVTNLAANSNGLFLMVKFTAKSSKDQAVFKIRDLSLTNAVVEGTTTPSTTLKTYELDTPEYKTKTVINKWDTSTAKEQSYIAMNRDENGNATAYAVKDGSGTKTPVDDSELNNGQLTGRRLVVYSENQNASLNDTFSVPVYIKENTGFNTLDMWARYDSKRLTFESVSLSSELKVYADLSVYEYKDSTGAALTDDTYATTHASPALTGTRRIVKISITAAKNIELGKGTELVRFNFKLTNKGDTEIGAQCTSVLIDTPFVGEAEDAAISGGNGVEVDEESAVAVGFTNVNTEHYNHLESSIILGQTHALGDVNNDGVVNLVDAAMLLQFYNGVRMLDEASIDAGKINADDVVTLVDVLLIMKYYNTGTYTLWKAAPLTALSDITTS